MKKPFALIGLTYLSVLAALFYFYGSFTIIVFCGVSAIAALLFTFLKFPIHVKKTALAFCLAVIAACCSSVIFTKLVYEPVVDGYAGKKLTVSGVICEDVTRAYDNYYYQIETDKINGKAASVKISLTSYRELELDVYDRITCTLNTEVNSGGYYKSTGAFLRAYTDNDFSYSVGENPDKPLYYYAVMLRREMESALGAAIPSDCSSLCEAVLLGNKFALSQSVRNDFTDTGVSFLIVVSGMHLAIINSFMLGLVKRIRLRSFWLRRALKAFSVFAVSIMFMAVTGFTPSVCRAGIMIMITFVGECFARRTDTLNSLGAAAILLTANNPFSVGDIGMLLSFAATAGIALWAAPISSALSRVCAFIRFRALRRMLGYIIELLSMSISATLCVLPFSILYFGRLSPYCVILSVLCSPVIGLLIASALLVCLFTFAGVPFLAIYPAIPAALSAKFILLSVGLFADLPLCTVNAEKPYFYIWLILTAALALVGLFVKRKRYYVKLAAAVSVCALVSGCVFSVFAESGVTGLTVCSVNDGITAAVSRGVSCSVVSCGGSDSAKDSAVDSVRGISASADYIIAPSKNNRYDGYLLTLSGELDVSNILIYDSDSQSGLLYFGDGYTVSTFSDDERLTLQLNENTADRIINVNGHTYQYIVSGAASVLIMPYNGNADELPENCRTADYLVISGAPKNLELLDCGTVIISCAEDELNRVKAELGESAENILSTADGAVEVKIG